MLKRRIIPCLDVAAGRVVKGVQFQNHQDVGDILTLAQKYACNGADELVFYDIKASCDNTLVSKYWIADIARLMNIPFCVAGGIKTIADAELILSMGADKISINSPALNNPDFIDNLAKRFGSQCVVVGIDSFRADNNLWVYQYTGDRNKTRNTQLQTDVWAREAVQRGAGELVINCMNQDGCRGGYDLSQLDSIAQSVDVPVVASGGAGCVKDFVDVFQQTEVSAALAASVFHQNIITIPQLKQELFKANIAVRL